MTAQQLPLDPVAMLPLREAYESTPSIKKRCTFEQALTIKRYEICLRCLARARKLKGLA